MSDLMNAIIAAKLMGGGGGGGSGLPPITPASGTVIYPEETLTFNPVAANIYAAPMSDVAISADEEYTVFFDGVEYSNPPYITIQGQFVFGNASVIGGGSDTGEPFAISNAMGGVLMCFCAQSGEHSLEISQGEPQSPPDGNVLMVQNGEWAAAALPQSGSAFYITPTYSGSTITAVDRTFDEILAAIDAGLFPVLWSTYNGHRSGAPYFVSDIDASDYISFRTIAPNTAPKWVSIAVDGTISQGS